MDDHEMIEAVYAFRWWQTVISLLCLFGLILLVVSKWLTHSQEQSLSRRQHAESLAQNEEYMTEVRALLTAARVAAESARANKVDTTIIAKRADENVTRLERTIPEATVEKLREDGTGGH